MPQFNFLLPSVRCSIKLLDLTTTPAEISSSSALSSSDPMTITTTQVASTAFASALSSPDLAGEKPKIHFCDLTYDGLSGVLSYLTGKEISALTETSKEVSNLVITSLCSTEPRFISVRSSATPFQLQKANKEYNLPPLVKEATHLIVDCPSQLERSLRNLRSVSSITLKNCDQESINLIDQQCPLLKKLRILEGTFSYIPSMLENSVEDAYICSNKILKKASFLKAKKIFFHNCVELDSLQAPEALDVRLWNLSKLNKVNIPKATFVSLNDCFILDSLSVPSALIIEVIGADDDINLQTLDAPQARKIEIEARYLSELNAPQVEEILIRRSDNLEEINFPNALKITLAYCWSLKHVGMPRAQRAIFENLPVLESFEASDKLILSITECPQLEDISETGYESEEMEYEIENDFS